MLKEKYSSRDLYILTSKLLILLTASSSVGLTKSSLKVTLKMTSGKISYRDMRRHSVPHLSTVQHHLFPRLLMALPLSITHHLRKNRVTTPTADEPSSGSPLRKSKRQKKKSLTGPDAYKLTDTPTTTPELNTKWCVLSSQYTYLYIP